MKRRPRVFIGSSSEGITIAEALQVALDGIADVVLWTQGIFDLSSSYLESLIKLLDQVDFAILALTPDDLIVSRGHEYGSPRDNVLFELGLFMGRLGRQRCFFVYERGGDMKLPTDLLGITAATYHAHASGNMEAALGAAATRIKRSITEMGRRPLLRLTQVGGDEPGGVPDISGKWAGFAPDGPNPDEATSTMEIDQHGSLIHAVVDRKVRNGTRRFEYEGRFSSGQLVMFFQDQRGKGFIIGTMVLHLAGNLNTFVGRSTYYHHTRNEVVSTARMYKRL